MAQQAQPDMSAPTAQPAQPDQPAPPALLVAHQAPLVQLALKAPPGSGDQPACKGQQASALRALRAPVLRAQLEPQERLALV